MLVGKYTQDERERERERERGRRRSKLIYFVYYIIFYKGVSYAWSSCFLNTDHVYI
jgi:hypothetical protein